MFTLNDLDCVKSAGGSVLEGKGNFALLAVPRNLKRFTLDDIVLAVTELGLGEDSSREGDDSCDGKLHFEGDWHADVRQLK